MLVIWNKVLCSIAKHRKSQHDCSEPSGALPSEKGEEFLDCESGNEEPGEAEGAHDNAGDCLGEMTPLNLERENGCEHSELHHEESVMATMARMWMHFIDRLKEGINDFKLTVNKLV